MMTVSLLPGTRPAWGEQYRVPCIIVGSLKVHHISFIHPDIPPVRYIIYIYYTLLLTTTYSAVQSSSYMGVMGVMVVVVVHAHFCPLPIFSFSLFWSFIHSFFHISFLQKIMKGGRRDLRPNPGSCSTLVRRSRPSLTPSSLLLL